MRLAVAANGECAPKPSTIVGLITVIFSRLEHHLDHRFDLRFGEAGIWIGFSTE